MQSDTRPDFTNNEPIIDKLDKYGKLNNCTRRQLLDYCLKMQELALKIDSKLFENGIFLTIDEKGNIHLDKHSIKSLEI